MCYKISRNGLIPDENVASILTSILINKASFIREGLCVMVSCFRVFAESKENPNRVYAEQILRSSARTKYFFLSVVNMPLSEQVSL